MPLKSWNVLLEEAGDAAGGFEVLPAADYDLEVVKSEAKMAGSGNMMYVLTCEVIAGPYGPSGGKPGKKIYNVNLVVSDNPTALGFFFRKMKALGIDKSFFSTNPSDSQVAEALMNRKFRGQVIIKPYQGEDRNEIKSFFPISATASTPAPPPAPSVPAPTTPAAPAAAAPQTPTAPAPAAPAAAVAPPAPAPAPAAVAPPAPEQPVVPPVPDAAPPAPPVAAPAPVAEAPAAPAPAAPTDQLPPPPPPAGSPF